MRRLGPISRRIAAAACGMIALALPALAHPTSADLAEKFARGEYMTAASDAETTPNADDLAFAARSLLAQCMTGNSDPDPVLVDRALKDTEDALRLDPSHEEARLQMAIALSLKSRDMDPMAAWAAGYGEKGKKLAEDVLKTDPRNFYAHGFLAVWNLEVERRGGGLGAWMMGANLDNARRHYQAASGLAPDDVGVHWQYARALAALNLKGNFTEVAQALARAVSASATDHVEQVMQARAKQLLAAITTNPNPDLAQQLARELL